jgi:ribose-phosphate pyrophosphokinase
MLISTNFSDLLDPNIEIKAFPDGESYVRIPGISEVKDKEVRLFHRLYPDSDQSIFQAVLLLDTLKKAGAKPILISPYLPYSRQDKTFLEGEALSSEVLCKMLKLAGATKLITLDCHFLKKEGNFEYGGLEIENISMGKYLVEHAKMKVNGQGLEIISPDMGAKYLVEQHGGSSMEKVRGEYAEGDEAYRKIEEVNRDFEVKGKNVLILDDMISTGGTMLKAVDNVKKGGAKKVICAATHGFFLKGSLEKLKEVADEVIVTDSIPSEVSVVSFMPLLKEKGFGVT